MRLPDEPDIPPQINIVPMIDVIFAILTFFIISTLYLTRSEGLPVNLPKATTAETQQSKEINVTIQADGAIALNRESIDLDDIEEAVRSQIAPNSESLVVINADEAVNHGRVVSVMDRLRRVQGVKLAIAAQKQ
ncbi:MAG TPA: biopolymer transporter ExbD [Cyanobacteria bacterium UBA11149]|nr:biopolymer transporter ExbD [Cyanobacteria bacterium UBA11367]HBE59498.1 biopolymer transporter ExbD [Cyanobacteria bacterium UBA11366]HBK66876.1 biopolymer transporter ExbD [Cyanobacteria bacterium UBA11166]HBR76845.1 biopolymer transporter ExbD [Cyanobacteria bacterium UBA11159]HBS67701.1 biopolymer transporter ExbD [Cyanobacteria bacterium UBA11153]HBW90748.1 biopolymer transporter ExbD [Cyanobacteria bacterium UBA11149]